jgi:bla regulator protein BlaR1
MHELAHHRRRDSWSNLIPLAALCVHWYNPLVWLCQRAIRADRELATDEYVIRKIGAGAASGKTGSPAKARYSNY